MGGLFNFVTGSAGSGKVDAELDSLFHASSCSAPVQTANDQLDPVSQLATDEAVETGDLDPQRSAPETEAVEAADKEKLERTAFVGNLPVLVMTVRKELSRFKAYLKEFGALESIRFRSVATAKNIPKKELHSSRLSKHLHPDRLTCNAYVVFKEISGAQAFVEKNSSMSSVWTVRTGSEENDKVETHLQVDLARPSAAGSKSGDSSAVQHNAKLSVFVGNLGFKVENESLYKFFEKCGEINSVRIIRDRKTLLGKGFGYVTFANKASVYLACNLAGQELEGRPVRVQKALDMARKKMAETEGQHAAELRIRKKKKASSSRQKKPSAAKPKKLTEAQQTRKLLRKIKSSNAGMGKNKKRAN